MGISDQHYLHRIQDSDQHQVMDYQDILLQISEFSGFVGHQPELSFNIPSRKIL